MVLERPPHWLGRRLLLRRLLGGSRREEFVDLRSRCWRRLGLGDRRGLIEQRRIATAEQNLRAGERRFSAREIRRAIGPDHHIGNIAKSVWCVDVVTTWRAPDSDLGIFCQKAVDALR